MALKNAEGNYLRITDVRPSSYSVMFEIHRSEQARNNPSPFDQAKRDSRKLDLKDLLAETADPNKSIKDNLITAGYVGLKQQVEAYAEWEDC